ncbi:Peptidase family M28 [Spirosomataceae bacterium TFI 002]|nr:Peptidase family M28 [Spirosomataceae bacterium TFI 002]
MKIKLLLLLVVFSTSTVAQQIVNRDIKISGLVEGVSSDTLAAYVNKLVSFKTRSTLSNTSSKTEGIGAARNWVLEKFQSFVQRSPAEMKAYIDSWQLAPNGRRVDREITMGNVIAELKGNDPNDKRVIMVSGHIDSRVTDVMDSTSIAPGANDDGSGTVAVIELARVLSQRSWPTTIIFTVFTGEEQGLLGAEHMAATMKKDSIDLIALLNNDIMGSNNSSQTRIINNNIVRVFSEGIPAFEMDAKAGAIRQYGYENDGGPRQLARYVKEIGERYVDNMEVRLIYRNDRFLRGGDHTPFVNSGFDAVRLSEMNENYLHQHQDLRIEEGVEYGDLAKFMDFEYLRKNTAVNLATLSNLASAPPVPVEVKIDVRNLENYTTLTWQPGDVARTAGYYVLMRETDANQWQKKFYTTETKMRLPYSKDNYFFAVQSVSDGGHESLPVIPRVLFRR